MTDTAPAFLASPLVSVVVCTKDRARSLHRLLTSMVGMRVPADLGWELILVDNGSTDDTRSVAQSFGSRLPLRYIEDPVPGLSAVRNRGVAEAKGQYICWTDDDTAVDPNWLLAYVEAFRRHPEAGFFGGQIHPSLDAETPDWIRRGSNSWPLGSLLASRDSGDIVVPVVHGTSIIPWGANWAALAEAQRLHPYDPGLGYAPGRPRIADETDVIDRMLRAGAQGWWVPDAKVAHFVSGERLTWRRIFGHHVMQGATDAYLVERSPGSNWLSDRPASVLSMSRRGIWARAHLHHLRFLCWKLIRRPERAVRSLARYGYFHGFTAYWREKHS